MGQIGARVFAMRFLVGVLLIARKVEKSYYEYGLVITYYGNFSRDLLIEYTHCFLKKTLVGKINQTLSKINDLLGMFPCLKKIFKTAHPLVSSKPNEMHGSWFIYRIFYFKKNRYTLDSLRIYS